MKFNAQKTCICANKWRHLQINLYIYRCLKSVFGVATRHCYTILHGVEQFLNFCFLKKIPYYLYLQPKFPFWRCRTQITRQMPTNKTPHTCSLGDISGAIINKPGRSRPRKKLHVLGSTEISNSIRNMWASFILLKDSTRYALKQGNDFGL